MKLIFIALASVSLIGCGSLPDVSFERSEPFPTGIPVEQEPYGWPDFCERFPTEC